MKKMNIAAVMVLITAITFYACDVSKQLADVEKVGYQCNNYLGKVPNSMNRGQVLDMIRNYYNHQYQALHNPQSPSRLKLDPNCPVDSRAVFFNLDTLKKLIYYLELASKNFTAQEKSNLGLNIYFASYPKEMQKMHNGLNYTNRHTLVFLPSLFNPATSMAEDLDIGANLFGNKDIPVKLDNTFFGTSMLMKSMVGVSATNSNSMNSQNDGTLIPPPPPNTGNIILDLTDPN